MINHTQKIGDIPIWISPDQKFKEVSVSLTILFPLKKRDATIANICAKLFQDRLVNTPTKKAMTHRLDMMYGARLFVQTYSMGQAQVIDISSRTLSKRYVDEDLLKQQLQLVFDCLSEPLINQETVQEAKNSVQLDLKRIKENPQFTAFSNALAHAGPNTVSAIRPEGDLEDLALITIEEIQAFHQQCVDTFHKEIYLAGDVETDLDFADIPFFSRLNQKSLSRNVILDGYVSEEQTTNQTELIIVYETDIDPHHPLYYPFLVFVGLLGQGSSSLLFKTIREKHSLCYSIYTSQLIFDGLFYIATSINPNQESRVLELIQEQFDVIENEVLDLASTKAYLTNQLSGTDQDIARLNRFVFRNNRLMRHDTPETMIDEIMAVSSDDVKKVLHHILHKFVYSYKGVDDEDN